VIHCDFHLQVVDFHGLKAATDAVSDTSAAVSVVVIVNSFIM